MRRAKRAISDSCVTSTIVSPWSFSFCKTSMILADEPTGNLDSHSSAEILAIFQRLNALGKTVVMVTHESDVAAHCRRIVRMRDGVIASDEPVLEPRRAEDEIASGIGAGE